MTKSLTNPQRSFYRDNKFYISISLALLLTIIGLWVSATTANDGYFPYLGAMIFFPYAMLSTLRYGLIPGWVGILSLFQYLGYGALMWFCWRRGSWRLMIILLMLHLIGMSVAIGSVTYGREKDGLILIERFKR